MNLKKRKTNIQPCSQKYELQQQQHQPRCSKFKMADTFADTAKLILQSRKNANLLIDLLEKLDSSSSNEILKLITCLETVFAGFFSERLWQRRPKSEEGLDDKVEFEGDGRSSFSSKNIEKNKDNGEQKPGDEKDSEATSQKNAERVFADWAHSKYLHFVKTLLRLFSHEEKTVQKAALDCLMNFIVLEYNAKISSSFVSSKENYFPRTLFSRVIDHMLFSGQNAMKTQLKHFEGYLEFSDIQFYTLQNILRILNGKSKTISKNEALQNSLCSLLIHMTSQVADETTVGFVIEDEDRLQNIAAGSKRRKQLFSDTWISFLHLRLTSQCLKKVLMNLHDKIMPQMQDPKLLIDFLTDSYNLEGSIAMLALNGLFLLIQNYNLDYPDFFKKLYNLLNVDIFEVKYRDRFLALADLFLTSLNLPAYMAAAFIKRLARLSLRVSPDGIKIILVMIENLMKRHPSCKVLIHRKVLFNFYLQMFLIYLYTYA